MNSIQPIACLVLGLAGSGKSSFCRTLTQNADFKIMNGPQGTKEFRLARSTIHQCAKKCVLWSLIDTVGVKTENYKERNLFLDIKNQFQDDECELAKLDCVIFIHDTSSRDSLEEIKKVLNAVNFIDKNKNLIFVFTKYDQLLDKRDDTRKNIMKDYLNYLKQLDIPDIENKIVYWINEDPDEPKFMKRLKTDEDWRAWFEGQEDELIKVIKKCEPIPMEALKQFYSKLMEFCKNSILPNIFNNKINLEREKVEHSFNVSIFQQDWGHQRKNSFFRLCDFTEEKKKEERMQKENENFREQFENLEKNFNGCIYKYINSHFLKHRILDIEPQSPQILIIQLNEEFCELIKNDMGVTVTIFQQVNKINESLNFEFIDGKIIKITKKKDYDDEILIYKFGIQFDNMPKIESVIEILLKEKEREKFTLWENTLEEFQKKLENPFEPSSPDFKKPQIPVQKKNLERCLTNATEKNLEFSEEEFKINTRKVAISFSLKILNI